MRSKTSAIRVRNANPVATRQRHFSRHVKRPVATEKSCRIQSESCSSILRIQLRLFFDYHTLNRATLGWPGVINTNPLAGSQWRRHSFAGCVNDVRRRPESETYRALLAPDDDRLAGLICTY